MAKRDRTGIQPIHKAGCPATGWARCSCSPGYRAQVWDNVSKRTQYKTFPTEPAARAWRQDRIVAIRAGERLLPSIQLRDIAAEFFKGIEDGVVRGRGGHAYKPSVIRQYQQKWDGSLAAEFGHVKAADLRTAHVQKFVDRLVAQGAAASTVNNTITPLRVMLRFARRRDYIGSDPCTGLELPSGETARDRIIPPREAVQLLAELPSKTDRALWAVAFFTGLRRGEIMGLEWHNVDLLERELHVVRSYDPPSKKFIPTKNRRRRTVGLPTVLLPYLAALDGVSGLVFPAERNHRRPFSDSALYQRADMVWAERPSLHECRHTYASVMIAAGVNIKALSEMMGHSQVSITWDRYGHLMPGATAAATGLLDAYLAKELA